MVGTKQSFTIDYIREDDHVEVLAFLNKFFFRDSPFNKCLKTQPCPEMDAWAVGMMSENCSFKAFTETGQIIGVYLNTRIDLINPTIPDPTNCINAQYKQRVSFTKYLHTQYDLSANFPKLRTALEASLLSVDNEFRGLGIARKLTQRTLDFAKETEIPLVVCHCSSQFSALVCDATGFERVYELAYTDYVVDGENPILPEKPHTHYAVYVKQF